MKNIYLQFAPIVFLAFLGCGNDTEASSGFTSSHSQEFENHVHSHRSISDDQLERILKQRFKNDRTGVCVAAAVIENDEVSRAKVCANEHDLPLIEGNAAFEIGSISKTMTAAMLASFIEQGQMNLDDSLADHLPSWVTVPVYDNQPILMKHVLTHSSGLPRNPPEYAPSDEENFFADLSEQLLLESLANTYLNRAPGAQYEYSNMGYLLLSYIAARSAGMDLQSLLRERLFTPLKMKHAYISNPPEGTFVALGHSENSRQVAITLDFQGNLAGVGGIRATLKDMIKFVRAHLGHGDPATVAVLKQTQQVIDVGNSHLRPMGMAWHHNYFAGHHVLIHDGGTRGFCSIIFIEPEKKRAIIILEDAATLSGGYPLAFHLLDPQFPLPPPRLIAQPEPELLVAIQGQYMLGDVLVSMVSTGQNLIAIVNNEVVLELGYDSYGDFYPLMVDGVFSPMVDAQGNQTFIWKSRDDGTIQAQRL